MKTKKSKEFMVNRLLLFGGWQKLEAQDLFHDKKYYMKDMAFLITIKLWLKQHTYWDMPKTGWLKKKNKKIRTNQMKPGLQVSTDSYLEPHSSKIVQG